MRVRELTGNVNGVSTWIWFLAKSDDVGQFHDNQLLQNILERHKKNISVKWELNTHETINREMGYWIMRSALDKGRNWIHSLWSLKSAICSIMLMENFNFPMHLASTPHSPYLSIMPCIVESSQCRDRIYSMKAMEDLWSCEYFKQVKHSREFFTSGFSLLFTRMLSEWHTNDSNQISCIYWIRATELNDKTRTQDHKRGMGNTGWKVCYKF